MEMNETQKDILETYGKLKKTQKEINDLYEVKYYKLKKDIEQIIVKAGWNISADEFVALIQTAKLVNELDSLKKKSDDNIKNFVNNPDVLSTMASLLNKEE